MRWQIDPQTTAGLKIISTIPDLSPCLIEGRNGVGKTVAIHLLELASGKIPQEFINRPDLWASLKTHLGQTRITGTELHGATSIEVSFTPTEWPETLPEELGDWLGNCSIDGRPVEPDLVAALLSVEHISGTEDLADTLERHRATLEGQLETTARTLQRRRAQIQELASDLIHDLDRADPHELDRDLEQVRAVEERVVARLAESQEAAVRLALLLRAAETKRKRDALDDETQQLLGERDRLVTVTKVLGENLEHAQGVADSLSSAVAAEGQVGKKLAAAQRLLRTRTTRVTNVRREVDQQAVALDLEPEEEQVAAAMQACDEEITTLKTRLSSLDTASELRSLVEQILPSIRSALGRLEDQTIADGYVPELTVRAAYQSLASKGRDLADQPAPAEVRQLTEALSTLLRRRDALETLNGNLAQMRRDDELVAEADRDYQVAQSQAEAATATGDESRTAHQRVGALEQELSGEHAKLALLQQSISTRGMVSPEDADKDIAQAERDLGIATQEWGSNEQPLRQASAVADEALAAAERDLAQARRRMLSTQTVIAEVIQRIRSDPRYSWLLTTNDDDPRDGSIDGYRRAREAAMTAVASLEAAENLLVTLQGLSQSALAAGAEDSALLTSSRHLIGPFRDVLGARLTTTLNRDAIRTRVFDGAEVSGIDPAARTITLLSVGGEVTTRPLASFSTGERAFAFTQARIADIEPSTKQNKLLFLDEFGAYVSADRLPDLAEFLGNDILRPIADQIVVILPLHVDYRLEVANTRGELRKRYEERLDQIDRLGYCAVPLQ